MTGNLIRQDNTYIGEGAPVTGDEITTNTALCGLNTFYIDKTNGASYVRTGVSKVTGDWTQIGGGGSSYSVYTANLTQTSTNAPVVTVLQNTLTGTITASRSGAGDYSIDSTENDFPSGRTFVMISQNRNIGDASFTAKRDGLRAIGVRSWEPQGDGSFVSADGYLLETSIEIRVYPE